MSSLSPVPLETEVLSLSDDGSGRIKVAFTRAAALYWVRAEQSYLVERLERASQERTLVEVYFDPSTQEILRVRVA